MDGFVLFVIAAVIVGLYLLIRSGGGSGSGGGAGSDPRNPNEHEK